MSPFAFAGRCQQAQPAMRRAANRVVAFIPLSPKSQKVADFCGLQQGNEFIPLLDAQQLMLAAVNRHLIHIPLPARPRGRKHTLRTAHAALAGGGDQTGIPYDDLLPMRPFGLNHLTGEIAKLALGMLSASDWSAWSQIAVGQVDPRIAYYKQAERMGLARMVSGLGTLILGEPEDRELKWTIRLIRHVDGKYSQHRLIGFDTLNIQLGGARLAVSCANEIANDIGDWRWYPRISEPDEYLNGRWDFQPKPSAVDNYVMAARFRGRKGFAICAVDNAGSVRVVGDGGRDFTDNSVQLTDSMVQPLSYSDLRTARREVEQRDAAP